MSSADQNGDVGGYTETTSIMSNGLKNRKVINKNYDSTHAPHDTGIILFNPVTRPCRLAWRSSPREKGILRLGSVSGLGLRV